jgi:hypothetical protein
VTLRPTPTATVIALIVLAVVSASAQPAAADPADSTSPQLIWSYDTEG